MTAEDKLAAILAAVQTDPGNRGLARDPVDNLFTATRGDFQAACRSIANHREPHIHITTGFYIPSAQPPAFETDGPLGALFFVRAMNQLNIATGIRCYPELEAALQHAAREQCAIEPTEIASPVTHHLWIECVGTGSGGRCYSMRGNDVTTPQAVHNLDLLIRASQTRDIEHIGIGDGGNEIGMGKIPHETVVKNIPHGDKIHSRVPANHLIVAGVSNWGAYALAAGVFVLRGVKPSSELFNTERECEILAELVRDCPLVDGVTGMPTATVDGLTWADYTNPLARIRDILEL
jgi:hypothetical protein